MSFVMHLLRHLYHLGLIGYIEEIREATIKLNQRNADVHRKGVVTGVDAVLFRLSS